ncbi:MAG: Omp28-related outer membrane protein, partial [Bacteroidetes bacterium]|nr:Omp28-related outer membrane protein [Bacteroidota bacterium]
TRIQTINNLAPEVKIEISNSYNSSTRTSNINLEFDALQNMNGTYKLAVYLTEDSIVSAQTTTNDPDHSDDIIHDYVHRHVLRGTYNSTFGDTIMTGNISKNAEFFKSYSMILNPAWNENHCYMVVMVYNMSNYEIIQAEEKRIK